MQVTNRFQIRLDRVILRLLGIRWICLLKGKAKFATFRVPKCGSLCLCLFKQFDFGSFHRIQDTLTLAKTLPSHTPSREKLVQKLYRSRHGAVSQKINVRISAPAGASAGHTAAPETYISRYVYTITPGLRLNPTRAIIHSLLIIENA